MPLFVIRNYGKAVRAAGNLAVSKARTEALFPLDAETLAGLDDETLERLDAFRVRYAQLQDLLASKLFRGLLKREEEPPESMLDIPHAMEKRKNHSFIQGLEKYARIAQHFPA